jgi:hypothetical protein
MAKNRKNKSVAIRFGPAIKALLMCSLFVAAGVGYVWQKSLIADLERQLKTRESDLAKFQDLNEKLCNHLAELKSPEQLTRRLIDLKLGLVEPARAQVWWLPEPAEPPPARPQMGVQQYAARP